MYFFVLLVLSLWLFGLSARADSDSAFCTFRGYLAYELRAFKTKGLSASHVLRLVRFDSGRGVYRAGELALKDFQVDELTCHQDRIEIGGRDNIAKDNGYVKYVVEVAEPKCCDIIDYVEDPNRRFDRSSMGPGPRRLWVLLPRPIVLESDDPDHQYQLLVTDSPKRVQRGVEHNIKTEIVRMDSAGNITQRILLYDDHSLEAGD